MPGVGRNSYKAAMKKAKAKTNKKKTPLKMTGGKKKKPAAKPLGRSGRTMTRKEVSDNNKELAKKLAKKQQAERRRSPMTMTGGKKKGTGINNNKPLTAAQKARIKKQREQMAKNKKEGKPGTGLLNSGPRIKKPKYNSRTRR